MNSNPKRWYERQPKLSQAVRLMFLFPVEIKAVICDGIMVIANREFDASERMNGFKTLGVEKTMAIHKSKNKRREYDQHEVLHKAMNYLYILSEENQDAMSDHILQLVNYIHQYLSTCQAFKADPTLEDVAEITNTYVQRGNAEVERFINNLRKEMHSRILKIDNETPIDFLDQQGDRMMGMKIIHKVE